MKPIREWFAKPAPQAEPTPIKREIVVVRSTRMLLNDWTKDAGLVKVASTILDLPEMQTMMAILRNENPSNFSLPTGANHDDRIAAACRAEGYAMALNNLEALGRQTDKPRAYIESTFEPEKSPIPL